jgi:hypothetical protein
MRPGVIRAEAQRGFVVRQRLRQAAGLNQGGREVGVGLGPVGPQTRRLLQMFDGLRQPAGLTQGDAQIESRFGVRRIETDRFGIVRRRLGRSTERH